MTSPSPRRLEGSTLMTAFLVVATLALVVIAADEPARPPSAQPALQSLAPPAPVPIDPALQRWRQLLGRPASSPLTTMAPPTTPPAIVDMPVRQYRAGGIVRVYRARPVGFAPRSIVLHATGGGQPGSGFASLAQLHRFFDSPGARASAHYAVDRGGRIARFVDESMAAFHVATPGWNDISIGIELLNDNSGNEPFTPAQLDATSRLVRALGQRYGIPVEGVVRHRTIQSIDRRDPAGNFPWGAWVRTLS